MKPFKCKIMPVSLFDVTGVESWLSEQAKMGLRLHGYRHALNSCLFEPAEPQETRYRLEPVQERGKLPDEEQRTAYAETGWQFMTRFGDWFDVYASDDPDAVELHTDAVTQSYTYEELCKRQKWSTALLTVCVGLMFAILINTLDDPLYYLITQSAEAHQILGSLIYLLILLNTLGDVRRIRRLRTALEAGIPMRHQDTGWKRRSMRHRAARGFLLLFAVGGLAVSGYALYVSVSDSPETYVQAPGLSLASLEPDGFQYEHDWREGYDHSNFLSHGWSLLAPEQYNSFQRGFVEGEIWPDGSGTYNPSLYIHFYRVRFAGLAAPLVQSLLEQYMTYVDDPYKITESDDERFERLVIVNNRDHTGQTLFAFRGSRVLFVQYYGLGDMTAHLEQLSSVLDEPERELYRRVAG